MYFSSSYVCLSTVLISMLPFGAQDGKMGQRKKEEEEGGGGGGIIIIIITIILCTL